jgi:hypothetical protein
MSEFYEIMSPDLFLTLKSTHKNLFPLECMICYDECTLLTPIAILPCFHIIHADCANKTIDMSFRRAIHPNTILPTWEFHCPQKDSRDSISENGRLIKQALGRPVKPLIPRCLNIPIPNVHVDAISYFKLPYVMHWYQHHTQSDAMHKKGASLDSMAFIAFRIGLVLLSINIIPSSVWFGVFLYYVYQLYLYINTFMYDEMRLLRVFLSIVIVCISNKAVLEDLYEGLIKPALML